MRSRPKSPSKLVASVRTNLLSTRTPKTNIEEIMHKLLVLYPEPTDRQEFTTYYEAVHFRLAQKLPGMLGCRYSLDMSGQDEASGYFGVFEADFENEQALAQALSSPEGADVQADVPNYATGGAVVLSYPVADSWPAPPRRG